MEVIVAIMVIGVGTSIIMALFSNTITLSQLSRDQMVAASLAEERQMDIRLFPSDYDWSEILSAPAGELARLWPVAEPALGAVASPPNPTPPSQVETRKSERYYEKFSWKTFGRKPSEDAAYIELTVVVMWQRDGRMRSFALTSTVARVRLEDRS